MIRFAAQKWNGKDRAIALSQTAWFQRLLLVVWLLVPLLSGFFNLETQSLVAHDEGLYTTRARAMLQQQDWIHPWDTLHHKTPGSYWILAVVFQLFGISEVTARLPSIAASVVCALLLYEIAQDLLNRQVACWSVLILSTSFLWVQYSRFATPDVIFIALFLGGLVCLLKAEKTSRWGAGWRFWVGGLWGLAFLVRSFLVVVPIAALLPYLLLDRRRHRHLYSPWLYGGMVTGLLPTVLWLWAVEQRLGVPIGQSLVNFPVRQATGGDDHFSGFGFYLASLGFNTLPWGLFALIGLGLLYFTRFTRQQRLLLGAYPLVIYGLLGPSTTHLHHYALAAYPMLAILAAIALTTLQRSLARWAQLTIRSLALLLGLLGAVLLVASMGVYILRWQQVDWVVSMLPYGAIALTAGLAWTVNFILWITRSDRPRWCAGLLLANWLTLSAAGASGVLGNANPDLKAFLLQPDVQPVLAQNPIILTPLDGKLDVLFRFYTPQFGQRLESVQALPPAGYAWVWDSAVRDIPVPYTVIDQYEQVVLVELGE